MVVQSPTTDGTCNVLSLISLTCSCNMLLTTNNGGFLFYWLHKQKYNVANHKVYKSVDIYICKGFVNICLISDIFYAKDSYSRYFPADYECCSRIFSCFIKFQSIIGYYPYNLSNTNYQYVKDLMELIYIHI